MYLKSIEVQGFKSFANKILFEFHNGITAIVGPNGSGKSNVADAVRWVLGEQRVKQLRGASMQDVIFSGTENRKPLSYAYVAITLDNSDHQLQIDYEEVTIARRVYRSGESEYLINGITCRLKDVNELFYDTGIGKEGYSIIGQGQIDKILSGKPEERRELFDEAAGIVKFKRRKAIAQKKLEDEKQNLFRVNDILSELEKQVEPLEKQSEIAKEYLKKKEELKNYDVNMFLMEANRIREQEETIHKKLEIANTDLTSAKAEYENKKAEYEKLERDLGELDEKIESYREESNNTKVLIGQLEGNINVLKEQINTSLSNDEHLKTRIDTIKSEIEEKEKEKEKLNKEKKNLDEELLSMSESRGKAAKNLEAARIRVDELNTSIEIGKNDILDLLNKRSSTKAKIQRFDTMLEQIQIRKAELNQKLLKIKSDESSQEEIIKKYETRVIAVSEEISSMEDMKKRDEQKVQEIQNRLALSSEALNKKQSEYHREKSRLESLKNITERYDGYGNSIRRVMEYKDKEPGVIGVVADIIKVEKQYEVAIETALGGSIQNVVTDNEHTAKRMIEYLKKNKFGRSTFLPLSNIGGRSSFINEKALSEPGVIGLASSLIKTEGIYQELGKYLLGKTLVVDTIDHAILLGKKFNHTLRIVTLEGESLNPGGSMTGGAFKNTSNLLGRRREIEELESLVGNLQKIAVEMEENIKYQKEKRENLRKSLESTKKELQERYILQNTSNVKWKQAKNRKEEILDSFREFSKEGNEIEKQILHIGSEKEFIEKELSESIEREKQIEEKIEAEKLAIEEAQEIKEEYQKENSKINMDTAALNQKYEFNRENICRVDSEIIRLHEEINRLLISVEETSVNVKEKENKIQLIFDKIEIEKEKLFRLEEKLKTSLKNKEEISNTHKQFFKKREELSSNISILDKETYRLEAQKEKLEELMENQINYMWEEYELTYSVAETLRNEEINSINSVKKRIQELKEEIRKLGDVNVNSIEDFKNLQERVTFLTTQRDDLVAAEETLLQVIEELDIGMRKQFKDKFYQIQIEFDKVFKELFGGGKGTLELMEDEDILEAGIRIISQPPGKKLQNMMQLSGGEKALTAIALLFAIQNLKPSPFCLLDEIEAALDDSNVIRYAKYLHKLTKHTQFIIITHRRGTMAAADRLYGITMQEKGVSTLVSVNLIEDNLEQ